MVSADGLSTAEVRLIKGMLRLVPAPSFQEVLAYFTRPGREINHRVISEIASGDRWPAEPPASRREVLAFVEAMRAIVRPDPSWFVAGPGTIGGSSMRRAGELALDWWPVGQGLFATGSLRLAGRHPLVWAYDCGSSSGASLVDDALDAFERRVRSQGASWLALVTLSHFDRDHISGIVRLAARFAIRRLMLPYVPLWQRLLMAAEQGIAASDPVMPFFVDPAGFLSGIDGSDIGEILFVPPSGPDDAAPPGPEAPPAPPGEPVGGGDGEEEADPAELEADYGAPPPEAAADPALAGKAGAAVRFLAPAGRLVVRGAWEFVPYNDAGMLPKATPRFLSRVGGVAKVFLNDSGRRAKALATLKAIYGHHFGRSPKDRNIISLFLYSGPEDPRALLVLCNSSARRGFGAWHSGFSQLHTGDGYLDTPDRLDRLVALYSNGSRISRARILQVMHHGAAGNWHSGVAAALAPRVSIFCSEPGRYGHPHADVLRDFWPFGAVQADDNFGFHLEGTIVRP